MDKEILINKTHRKMEKIFTMIIKHYKYTSVCYSIQYGNTFILRSNKKNRVIAFYHFDYSDFEITSSYWNNHKKTWINYKTQISI